LSGEEQRATIHLRQYGILLRHGILKQRGKKIRQQL
jgi:hypothetical protein